MQNKTVMVTCHDNRRRVALVETMPGLTAVKGIVRIQNQEVVGVVIPAEGLEYLFRF